MNTKLIFLVFCLTITLVQSQVRVQYLCAPGSFWNGQRCLPCGGANVANGGSGSCSCTAYNTCDATSCSYNSYALENASGQTYCEEGCDENCWWCELGQTAELCYFCAYGYQMFGNICLPTSNDSHCVKADGQTMQCTECQAGYYLSQITTADTDQNSWDNVYNACAPCLIPRCGQCSSPNTCQLCQNGYTLQASPTNPPQCTECTSNCLTCPGNPNICTVCRVGYVLSSTGSCTACTTINSQCASCSSATVCTACNQGYFLSTASNGTVTCAACGTNCQLCSSATTCLVCLLPYAMVNNSCPACPTGCSTCNYNSSQQIQCTVCMNGYYLNTSNTCIACTTIDPNALYCSGPQDSPALTPLQITQCESQTYPQLPYFLATNAAGATSCVTSNTNTCLVLATIATANTFTCTSCLPGLNLLSGQCLACPENCVTCAANSGSTALQCSVCSPNFYLSTTFACVACTSNCISCPNNVCATCKPSFYLTNGSCTGCGVTNCAVCIDSSSTCSACKPGYFTFTNGSVTTCNPCPSDCLTCTSPGNVCDSCPSDSIKQNGGCVPLGNANCVLHDDSLGQCTKCQYGYYLNSGYCVECLSYDSGFVCRDNVLVPPTTTT